MQRVGTSEILDRRRRPGRHDTTSTPATGYPVVRVKPSGANRPRRRISDDETAGLHPVDPPGETTHRRCRWFHRCLRLSRRTIVLDVTTQTQRSSSVTPHTNTMLHVDTQCPRRRYPPTSSYECTTCSCGRFRLCSTRHPHGRPPLVISYEGGPSASSNVSRAYSNVYTAVSPGVSRRYSRGAMFSLYVRGTRGSSSGVSASARNT